MNKFTIVTLVSTLLVVIIGLIFLATCFAPEFTYSFLGICALSIFYVFTERWKTHDAVEFENRFWSLIAGAFTFNCVFTKDSPIRLRDVHFLLPWTIVFVVTFAAHNYERHLRRVSLGRVPNIRRIQSAEFASKDRLNAKQKLKELSELLDSIDQRWLSSTFQNMFDLSRVVYIENRIIAIFAEANTEELNLIMMSIKVGLILYKVKDHRMSRQLNRTKLLHTLVNDRVGEMNISARAMLLDGLQKMKLSAHHLAEYYVKQIIMKTKGDELSELKSMTDSKGDINSMHKLIYVDIRNETIKKDILKYISEQARIQASHSTMRTRAGRRRGQYAWRKILSDVDDTLSCSGGSWPAGIDTSFPKKTIYPGVLAFYKELDLGTEGEDEWDNSRLGNLVFLSARPHVYKDVSENVTYQKFRWLQETRGLHTSPSLLAGSLDTGGQFMVKGNTEPLAMKKYENFREYLTLYPEYSCIFVGDNGQGDVRTAEMVLSDARYKDNLRRVYIHEIQPLYMTYAKNEITKSRDCERICYFNTYVDAAIDAHKYKLIRSSGLRRVMEAAVRDFEYIPLSAWSYDIHTEGVERPISYPPSHQAVSSSSGSSLTQSARESRRSSNSLRRRNHVKSRLFGDDSNREKRVRELNRSLVKGNAVLAAGGFGSVRLLKFTARFAAGSPVVTLLGTGIVTRFRPTDGMYEVSLQWDSSGEMPPIKAYLTGAALLSSVPPFLITSASAGGSIATSSASVKSPKIVPALKTVVRAVKASSLPKPAPIVILKPKIPNETIRNKATPPTSTYAPYLPLQSTISTPLNRNGKVKTLSISDTSTSTSTISPIELIQPMNVMANKHNTPVDSIKEENDLMTVGRLARFSDTQHSPSSLPLSTSSSSIFDTKESEIVIIKNLKTDMMASLELEKIKVEKEKEKENENVKKSDEKDANCEISDAEISNNLFIKNNNGLNSSLSTTNSTKMFLENEIEIGSDYGSMICDKDMDNNNNNYDNNNSNNNDKNNNSQKSINLNDSNDAFESARPSVRSSSFRVLGSESLDEKFKRRLSESNVLEANLHQKKINLGKNKPKHKDKNEADKEFEKNLLDRLAGVRGSRVWTPYGLGILANYRVIDDKFEVLLVWGATCYAHRDSVVQLTDPVHTVSYVRIMRNILIIEEKEKEEKRKKEEFIISEQKELELKLKRRVIHLKEFQDNKIKMEKAMKLILNKGAISQTEKNSEIASNLTFEAALSPERKKRLSIIPAISRALSPLNMMRLDSINTFSPTTTTNRSHSKDELTIIGKNLDSIILKNLTLSPTNFTRNNSHQESLSGNDKGGDNPQGVNVMSPGKDRNENHAIHQDGSTKLSSSTSASTTTTTTTFPTSSIFSASWMHWPSTTSTYTTSNTTSSTSSNTPKNVSSLWGFAGKNNSENPTRKENEFSSYSNTTRTYVNTPYGMGLTQNCRPVYHVHTTDPPDYRQQTVSEKEDFVSDIAQMKNPNSSSSKSNITTNNHKVNMKSDLTSTAAPYKMPLSYTNQKMNDFHGKSVNIVRIPSERIQNEIIPSLTCSSRAVDLKNSGPVFTIHKHSTSTSTSTSVPVIEEKS